MTGFRIPDLNGQVFRVTGASTGIGAAVARALAAQGVQVAVHNNESGDAARQVAGAIEAAGGTAFLARGDLAEPSTASDIVARTARHFGRIDGLINNGGNMLGRVPVMESSDAHVRNMLDLNALSVVATSRAAVPWLRRQGGTIINTTSIAARNGGGNGAVLYAAAKAFVSNFTRGFAKEVIADGICVNAVAPGTILTPLHERFSNEAQMVAMVATIPMGRAGPAEDCVGAYLFLASDVLSGYITGQVLEVNGGQLMP
ncbi:MAG: SDR family NAD(P)-dependent oxidoreductase [Dongiaceae bacterium]